MLADFGLSRLSELDAVFTNESVTSSTTEIRGTARYMAPEFFTEKPDKPSQATDVWALGCVMLVSYVPLLYLCPTANAPLKEVIFGTLPYATQAKDPQIIHWIVKKHLPHPAAKYNLSNPQISDFLRASRSSRMKISYLVHQDDQEDQDDHDKKDHLASEFEERLRTFQELWVICVACWRVETRGRPRACEVANRLKPFEGRRDNFEPWLSRCSRFFIDHPRQSSFSTFEIRDETILILYQQEHRICCTTRRKPKHI